MLFDLKSELAKILKEAKCYQIIDQLTKEMPLDEFCLAVSNVCIFRALGCKNNQASRQWRKIGKLLHTFTDKTDK